eukprot:NODE_537_length_7002_cov_0.281762.p7 type:complete len:106 gc:universal NODE_537_length_7002_cov_0.281762:4012-4329(+)
MSQEEFQTQFKNHLETTGEWDKMHASLKAQAYLLLLKHNQPQEQHESSQLINFLISDYLKYHGYIHTLDVFKSEAQPVKKSKKTIATGLNLECSELPLLYNLINK